MKKSILLSLLVFIHLAFISCDNNKKAEEKETEISASNFEEDAEKLQKEMEEKAKNMGDNESNDEEPKDSETEKLSSASYTYPKNVNESEIKKDILDRTDRSDCKIYGYKFSDGVEGKLVNRDGDWFSYSIWGKKREKPFASKEDGLQKIWEEGTNLRNVGGAIGSGLAGQKKVPLKKDGTPDMRYSVNK